LEWRQESILSLPVGPSPAPQPGENPHPGLAVLAPEALGAGAVCLLGDRSEPVKNALLWGIGIFVPVMVMLLILWWE